MAFGQNNLTALDILGRCQATVIEGLRPKDLLDLLVNLRLRDATRSTSSLEDLMREINQCASERGLTPEISPSIFGDN